MIESAPGVVKETIVAQKFNPAHAARLHDPERLKLFPPDVMWHALGDPEPRAILDVGAGTGLLTSAFARLAPSAVVYAADTSGDMLAFLRAHVPADVAERVVPVLSAEESVPLPDGAVDVVTMVALYHELEDPRAMLREVVRLLRPGGRLLIVDWKKQTTCEGPPLEHRVDGRDIVAAAEDAGFEDAASHDVLEDFSVITARRPNA